MPSLRRAVKATPFEGRSATILRASCNSSSSLPNNLWPDMWATLSGNAFLRGFSDAETPFWSTVSCSCIRLLCGPDPDKEMAKRKPPAESERVSSARARKHRSKRPRSQDTDRTLNEQLTSEGEVEELASASGLLAQTFASRAVESDDDYDGAVPVETEDAIPKDETANSDDEGGDGDEDASDVDNDAAFNEDDTDNPSEEDPFDEHFGRLIGENAAAAAQKKTQAVESVIMFQSTGEFIMHRLSDEKEPVVDVKDGKSPRNCHVRQSLVKNIETNQGFWTRRAGEFFAMMNSYTDLFHFAKNHEMDLDVKRSYSLHVLNHILKARSRIIAHNMKLSKRSKKEFAVYRDQSFTRPKALILVPFKHHALQLFEIFCDLLNTKEEIQVMNRKKFLDNFGLKGVDPVPNLDRPEDFRETFKGNTRDGFRVGIGIAKKTLKMYTDFASSDILIADPLGLRMIIGEEGQKQNEYDFLSSIEILILDQADIFMMQNWEHVLTIMKNMNRQPKDTTNVDFSRVRTWVLNGWNSLYRQTMIFSAFRSPEIQALINRSCFNYGGSLTAKATTQPVLTSVVVSAPHCFHRIPGSDHTSSSDARFRFFVEKILPQMTDKARSQTMIFVPSYFDFVRIRNHFKREDISFVQIGDYTPATKVARARDLFFHGKKHFLLYTERFHFFYRYRIRGIRHILFYGLPHYTHYYAELCNMMVGDDTDVLHQFTSDVLYSKFDAFSLTSIVGPAKAQTMLQSDKTVHLYVTSPDE
ncbi:hypothetical protein RvY_15640 [Ramazzottius varieornatus]|uniref:U3 small nucleolar RNA-associated protein 25 homolog n=1 Tax=Ramazzottius varieornatus TaxID=947166 RepID=A0A1D1VVM5_RAMVA|nr:hypothetical protein RvY_15640 [Ramazzottius varieornatus]